MSFLFELIGELVLWTLLWIVLLPVLIVVSTPIILIVALFQPIPSHYPSRVIEWYRAVFDLWLQLWTLF